MPGILVPQVFEGVSSLIVIEVIDIIEAFCRAFLELRCFQALCEKCIWLAPEYSCKNNYADGKSIRCHTSTQCKAPATLFDTPKKTARR